MRALETRIINDYKRRLDASILTREIDDSSFIFFFFFFLFPSRLFSTRNPPFSRPIPFAEFARPFLTRLEVSNRTHPVGNRETLAHYFWMYCQFRLFPHFLLSRPRKLPADFRHRTIGGNLPRELKRLFFAKNRSLLLFNSWKNSLAEIFEFSTPLEFHH